MTSAHGWGAPMDGAEDRSTLADYETRLAILEAKLKEVVAPEPVWNWRFIRIKRTADVIAFVALALSLFTAVGAIIQLTNTEDIVPFAPHQIVISNNLAIDRPLPAAEQVVFSTVTQYVNQSYSGHVGVVQSELLNLVVKLPAQRKKIQQFQYQLVRSHSTGGTTSTASGIAMEYTMDPSSFAVSPMMPSTHEVLFIPFGAPLCLSDDAECRRYETKYSWADFIADMDKFDVNTPMQLEFATTAIIYGRPDRLSGYQLYARKSPPCTVSLTAFDRIVLRNNGWLAPLCR
jgi:hypothetical protein